MVDVKHLKRQQGKTNRKKTCIFGIIFLLIFSVFPLMNNADTSPQDTLILESLHTTTEQIPSYNSPDAPSATNLWWNTNWHYRTIYNVTGVGNISLSVNFTQLLHHSLDVEDKTFENTTIVIVRYYPNGTMVVVNTTWFNESATFRSRTNAIGTLYWRVSASSLYHVYFDVLENSGIRTPTTETPNLKSSGSVHATVESTQGW